jgi:hypothetical protein
MQRANDGVISRIIALRVSEVLVPRATAELKSNSTNF